MFILGAMEKLSQEINTKGLSVVASQLSDKLGVRITPQRLNNWRRRGIAWQFANEVADFLGVPPESIREQRRTD